ncbi:flavin reductase family protein [Microbacterium sp.]|uniref:flavin reductase family protein n=1 Tax=Microbacterium sp. TaxID=51671 RepID=UPI003C74026C
MSFSTSPIHSHEPLRISGLEMPWNRALRAAAETSTNDVGRAEVASVARALAPYRPQEFLAECVEVCDEPGDMMTFMFRRVDGAPLSFRSGQYLNIEFPVHGPDADPVDRSYSISSPPTRPHTFTITIKRDPKGLVSPWAHDFLRPGMVLDMLGPVGAFHLPDADRRARYLLLAAGAGITPIMSMVYTIHDLPGDADVVLLYHATRPGGFAFSDLLEYLAATDSRIKVYWSLGGHRAPDDWAWMAGRISAGMLNEIAPDANGRQVYACGPEEYLRTAEELLRSVGVDDTSINMEFFTGDHQTRAEYAEEVALASDVAEEAADADGAEPDLYGPDAEVDGGGIGVPVNVHLTATPVVPETPVSRVSDADSPIDGAEFATVGEGSLTMSFVRSKLNVRINPDERILRVAQRAGVRIPANCQDGMCGTCKIVKLDGDVDMNHQGGIRAREIDAGKFLPCCSTPLTDLVLEA